jgi:putative tryptophan/tyrosine transport system substrate-binding protein
MTLPGPAYSVRAGTSPVRILKNGLARTVFKRRGGAMRCLCLSLFLILAGASAAVGADMTVAVVKGNSALPYDEVLAGFTAGIKQRNVTADFVSLDEGSDQRQLYARIALIRPDLILCLDMQALERVSQIGRIPKIFVLITAANLEPWLDRGDIYGVSLDIAPAAQFRVLRQAFPGGRRVGVLYDPNHNRIVIEEAKRAAAAAGFNLQTFPVGAIKELPFAFEKLEKGAELLWTLYDQTVYSPESARYVLMQSLQRKIPVVGFSPHFAKAGALLALYGDYHDMGQQAALQALAIRNREENVVRLDRPRTVKIAVNDKVGRFMGITFTSSFLKMVNQSF